MKSVIVVFLVAIILLNASCTKDMREAFGEMIVLSSKLGEKFGEGGPNVSIGERGIAVTFVNASFNDSPLEEKKIKAREIALFVKDNYPKIERIQEISVSFGVYKNFGGIEYKNNLDFYSFKVSELDSIIEPTQQKPAI